MSGGRQPAVMFETILVPTAGDDRSDETVAHAAGLADAHGATLHTVHVVRPGRRPGLSGGGAVVTRGSGAVLAAAAETAAEAGVEATGHERDGDPAREILDCARSVGADLLVVGYRGPDRRRGLGGVARRVVDRAGIATLLV